MCFISSKIFKSFSLFSIDICVLSSPFGLLYCTWSSISGGVASVSPMGAALMWFTRWPPSIPWHPAAAFPAFGGCLCPDVETDSRLLDSAALKPFLSD